MARFSLVPYTIRVKEKSNKIYLPLGVLLLSASSLFKSDDAKTSFINALFSGLVFYLIIVFTLIFLMVLKRVHKLLSDEIENTLGNT